MKKEVAMKFYIPRMESSISKKYIFVSIRRLNVGYIDKIIEIPIDGEPDYKKVIILFKTWYKNDMADFISAKLLAGEKFNYIHNYPWYWRIKS